jgi:hypothetical protein
MAPHLMQKPGLMGGVDSHQIRKGGGIQDHQDGNFNH